MHLALRIDHIDEGAGGAALHRAGRHHDHLLQGIDRQPHIDELARPELLVGVGKFGLELHCAGRLIDLVVDHLQRALVDQCAGVGLQRLHRQRTFGEGRIDLRHVLLRQVENHVDRLELGEHHQPAGVGRAHHIADVDQADAGAAVDRRGDLGVAENGARIVDRRLIGFHLRLELRDQSALRVGLLPIDRIARCEPFITLEVEPRIGELRLVLRLLGDRLVERRLIGGRIDLGEHVALGDLLAFVEIDAGELAVHLRLHGDGLQRARGADCFEIDRHVFFLRRRRQHRHRAARAGKAAAAARRVLRGAAARPFIDDDRGDHADQHEADQPSGPAAFTAGVGVIGHSLPLVSAASPRRAPGTG